MPTIPVNDHGHSLYYEDSGVPSGITQQPYTTLIIVHGTAFHAAVFKRLLPLGSQYNLRLVLVNRRDYPGSSAYTKQELDLILGSDEGSHNEFARARGAEFAAFIKYFVEHEGVPKSTPEGKHGGVVLMAWSSGNAYALPILSFADSIPESTRAAIEPYFRSFVMFDAPRMVIGLPPGQDPGPGVTNLRDTSLSHEERARGFDDWVGAYYTHASVTSCDIADLQHVPAAGARRSVSAAEARELTYYEAVFHSDIAARVGPPSMYAERARRALFDDEMAQYWPACRVNVVWCENSIWPCVDTAWAISTLREKADEEGIKGRNIRVVMMPGMNHFPHWDEPDYFMKFFTDLFQS